MSSFPAQLPKLEDSREDQPLSETERLARQTAPLSIDALRSAIQNNRFSFPAQAPVFSRQSRAEIQWRLAVLYFVRNWSCRELGRRYAFTPNRVRQLLYAWVARAKVLGYLQEIPAVPGPVLFT